MRTKPRREDLSVAEGSTGNGAGARGADENALGLLEPVPLAAYELLPSPTLRPDQIDAIVTRHGLDIDGPILAMASKGVVHGLWALGTHWVLRVPKNEAMCLGDHRCEAAAIPLARVAGVTTPDLIVFDDSGAILDVPYSIVERVDGRSEEHTSELQSPC